jgi:DNA-binding beta-propeller fold protein YncE
MSHPTWSLRFRVAARGGAWLLALASGCAGPGPVFPPVEPAIVWPRSGDPPRFAWVGKIEGEADLKRPRSFWKKLTGLLVGQDPPAIIQSAFGAVATRSRVLYVSDPDLHAVHRFDLERREYRALTRAGGNRLFESPMGLAVLGDKLVVSDRAQRTVTVLSASGEPEAVVGEESLEGPVGVAVGPITGRIYVADVPAHQVKVFHADGRAALEIGTRGEKPGQFNFPTHVACDAEENVYVSDSLNFRIQVFDSHGRYLRSFGRNGDFPGDLSQPKGIAVDAGGRVYVVDSHFENFQVFSPGGDLLLAVGEEGTTPGQFWLPVGISIDDQGWVWVGDLFNHRVQAFRYLGEPPAGGKS